MSEADGQTEIYTVVGVDELDFAPNAVSWISQIGKALLASELGDRITLEDNRSAKIVRIVQDKEPLKAQSAQ